MAYRKVTATMVEIKEVLRLWLDGTPIRRIARQVGVGRNTVRGYATATSSTGGRSKSRRRWGFSAVLDRHRPRSYARPTMRTITAAEFAAAEDALLDRWAARLGGRFYQDGAVGPAGYQGAARRIVFVLKETDVTPDEPPWDLRRELRERALWGRTWNMVAYWAFGLLNGLLPWSDVPNADAGFRRRWLGQVAVLNLNKAGGVGASHIPTLCAAARESAAELREHLALLDPDLIVCGGTGDIFAVEVLRLQEPAWRTLRCGTAVLDSSGGRAPVLRVHHPQARSIPGAVLYGEVIEAARGLGVT